jgi:hypothetical protein
MTSLMNGFVGVLRIYRRSAYAKTSGYDPEILYAEDRDLVYKMEEVTPFVFVDQALYKYRYVPHSQSNDPHKRKIGMHNHGRAVRNALIRRQITGRRKVGYLLWFYSNLFSRRACLSMINPLFTYLNRFVAFGRTPHYLLVRNPYDRVVSFYKDKLLAEPSSKLCSYAELQRCQRLFCPHLQIDPHDSPTTIREKLLSLSSAQFIDLLPDIKRIDRRRKRLEGSVKCHDLIDGLWLKYKLCWLHSFYATVELDK